MARHVCIIVLAGILLFFVNLGVRDFWGPDEGDFAQIVRELDTDRIVPHLNAEPYAEKPPLFYYVTFLSKKALPFRDELSLRLPTALFALAIALFFYLTVAACFGRIEGLIATIVLMTSPLFYWQARFLQLDMLFAAFVVSCLLSFFWFYRTGRPFWLYPFFILLGLAFMTKGPLAVLLTGPPAIITLALARDWRPLRMKETYIGIVLLVAIILPWYLAILAREGLPFLQENVVHQNFTRFFEAWSHRRPFYYYFTTLPLDFFPWSLLLPPALFAAVKRWKSAPERTFFMVWFCWLFLFLSLSSGKISKYMLPALPALALLVSLVLFELKNYGRWAFSIAAAVLLVFGVAVVVVKPGLYREFSSLRFLFAPVAVALAALVGWTAWRRGPVRAAWALAGSMAVLYVMANLTVYEKWNIYKSPRPIAEKVAHLTAGGIPWVYYGSMRGVYIYYAGKAALHVDDGQAASLAPLGGRLREFYVLTRKREVDDVRAAFGQIDTVAEQRVGDTPMVVVHVRARP